QPSCKKLFPNRLSAERTPVRLVGVVGRDFPASGWGLLKSRNIDITNIQIQEGTTFRWGCEYSADFSERTTLFTELGVFENFKPVICDSHVDSSLVFLGNIQPQLQMDVARLTSNAEYVICDTMNLWIDRNVEKLWQVLQKVRIFLLNDEEAILLTGESDLTAAAEKLLKAGPRAVIIKQGSRGALLADGKITQHIPIYPGVVAVDPTGAGDTFAAGLIGHLAVHGIKQLTEAVITAAAVASFTVSGFGLEGLLKANSANIEDRRNTIKELMQRMVLQKAQV
nr:sugar kinase [FCB group bacterium]